MADERADEQLRAVVAEGERALQTLNERHRVASADVQARVDRVLRGESTHAGQRMGFGTAELVYAADARCNCGAGFAYPRGIGPHGAWYCSRLLRGLGPVEAPHSQAMPFVFWSVKSEDQPSAGGLTTRGPDEPRG